MNTCPVWFTNFVYNNLFYGHKCIWCRHEAAHVEIPKDDWTCSIMCTMLYDDFGPRDLLSRDEHGNIMIPPISERGNWKRQIKKNN